MSLCIIVPCYNEAKRFPLARFEQFISSHENVHLILVDDGSKDNTLDLITTLATKYSEQISVIALPKNKGKATAVQEGMWMAYENKSITKFAYLDADLSTSLEECFSLSNLINSNSHFVFGSRVLKEDNTIERKWYRYIIGRVIANLIAQMLGIRVYDTQCGCKIISRDWVKVGFDGPFSSRWLFDVELFYRFINAFGKEQMVSSSEEIPLKQWIDTDDSRVKFSYFFKLWSDLWLIRQRYKK